MEIFAGKNVYGLQIQGLYGRLNLVNNQGKKTRGPANFIRELRGAEKRPKGMGGTSFVSY